MEIVWRIGQTAADGVRVEGSSKEETVDGFRVGAVEGAVRGASRSVVNMVREMIVLRRRVQNAAIRLEPHARENFSSVRSECCVCTSRRLLKNRHCLEARV